MQLHSIYQYDYSATRTARMDKHEMERYIVSHLDTALEQGWIKLYLQPLVRTITDSYSGAEALARWADPTLGMIMPDMFVPVLEREGLIWKVDCFMVTETMRLQKERIDAGLPVGRISVNLSRQDFETVDVAAFLQRQINRFGIRKDLIAIELTESLLVQNKERMVRIVKELRSDGFQIWMDDFGSGYSSLIFLNDYTLDLIKLDMGFLRSFTHTSRTIMRNAVDMAKKLGIRTLAEGVETEEQVRFLKEIGCDMMQGFYYTKPFPAGSLPEFIERRDMEAETIEWTGFYDRADAYVINSDTPRAVMEYHRKTDQLHFLFLNQSEKEQLRSLGRTTVADSEFVLNNRDDPLHANVEKYLERVYRTGESVTMYAMDNSCFVRTSGRLAASREDRCIFVTSIVNVTKDRNEKIGKNLDKSLADLVLLFDDVHLLNPEADTADNLINNLGINAGLIDHDRLRAGLQFFCDHMIYPEDRERYRSFADADTMIGRLKKTSDGVLRGYFRVRIPAGNAKGSYRWNEFNLLLIPGSEKVLSCIKNAEPTES